MNIDERIIEEVRCHEELYNPSASGYKNTQEKEKIWKEIGERLDVPEEFLKKRWKGLRDTFIRIRRSYKELPSGSGEKDSMQPKWKYYTQMSFLNSFPRRDSVGNLQISPEVTSPDTPDRPETPNTSGTLTASSEMAISEPIDKPTSCETIPKRMRCEQIPKRIREKFFQLLDMASEKISQELLANATRSSTSMLFEALAQRIQTANLTSREIILIENAVSEVVNQKLVDFMNKGWC